jgi:hypothetical protein
MVTGATKEPFPIRILKGYGYMFLAQVMSFFINMSISAFITKFILLQIFACACTTLLTLGLQFNWAYNCAKRDEILDRQGLKPYDRFMPAKLAVCAGIVPMGLYVALVLSKLGVIANFLPIYSIISIWQLPYRTFFSATGEISQLGIEGLICFGILTLLIPATVAVTYILIKRGTDFSGIIYKKDKID